MLGTSSSTWSQPDWPPNRDHKSQTTRAERDALDTLADDNTIVINKADKANMVANQPTLTLNSGEMFGSNPPKLTPQPDHGAMGIKFSQPEHSPDGKMLGRTPPQQMPNMDHNADQTHGDQQPCCSKDTPSIIRALPCLPRTEAGKVVKCGNPGCILCPVLTTETTVRSRLSKRKHRICGECTCHTQRCARTVHSSQVNCFN